MSNLELKKQDDRLNKTMLKYRVYISNKYDSIFNINSTFYKETYKNYIKRIMIDDDELKINISLPLHSYDLSNSQIKNDYIKTEIFDIDLLDNNLYIINIIYKIKVDDVCPQLKNYINLYFRSSNMIIYGNYIYRSDTIILKEHNPLIQQYFNNLDELLNKINYYSIYNAQNMNDLLLKNDQFNRIRKTMLFNYLPDHDAYIISNNYLGYSPYNHQYMSYINNKELDNKLLNLYILNKFNNLSYIKLKLNIHKISIGSDNKELDDIFIKEYVNLYNSKNNIESNYKIINNDFYKSLKHKYKINNDFTNKKSELFLKKINLKNLNIELFEHQLNNISWMMDIETNNPQIITNYINNNIFYNFDYGKYNFIGSCLKNYVKISNNNDKYKIYKLEKEIEIFKNIINFKDNYNLIENKKTILTFKGGIIADEVGLGKTLTVIGFIFQNKNTDRKIASDIGKNLIILPNRIVGQWFTEIKKYLGSSKSLSVLKICTITDIKKLKKANKKIIDFDIVLISKQIFGNIKLVDNYIGVNNEDIDILNTKWHRIFIDEAHEVLLTDYIANDCNNMNINSTYDISVRKKGGNLLNASNKHIIHNILFNLKSNYKWCLTATPYLNGINNFIPYIYWLSDLEVNLINTHKDNFNNYNNSIAKYLFNKLNYTICNIFNYALKMDNKIEFDTILISKNLKADLQAKNIIDIPLIEEEIKYINLSSFEKEVYNFYKNSHYITEDDLFKLCTNLLITSQFTNSTNLDKSTKLVDELELFSLDDINKKFISNINNLLKTEEKNKLDRINKIKFNEQIIQNSTSIKSVLDTIDFTKLNNMNQDIANILNLNYKDKEALKYMNITACGLYNIYKNKNLNSSKIINNDNIYSKIVEFLADSLNISPCNLDDLFNNIYLNIIIQYEYYMKNVSVYYGSYLFGDIIYKMINSAESKIDRAKEFIKKVDYNIERLKNQLNIMENEDYINERVNDPCIICWEDYKDETEIIITKCRHIMCSECFVCLLNNNESTSCPECRETIHVKDIKKTKKAIITAENEENNKSADNSEINKEKSEYEDFIAKYGTKMSVLIKYLRVIFNGENTNKVIIFSQYHKMLKLIAKALLEFKINSIFCDGSAYRISKQIDKFKNSPDINVILLSSDKANSGCNLTEANYIFFIDVLNMDKERSIDTEIQAVGRAVRLGQKRSVKIVRFITKETVEEEKYNTNKYDIIKINN